LRSSDPRHERECDAAGQTKGLRPRDFSSAGARKLGSG
jgi:hypothetical protein